MIEVNLRFCTNNNIAPDAGRVMPKHAWSSGVVRIEGNPSHAIKPGKPRPFHSLLDVRAVVEKALIEHGIFRHPSRKTQKYPKNPNHSIPALTGWELKSDCRGVH